MFGKGRIGGNIALSTNLAHKQTKAALNTFLKTAFVTLIKRKK